MSRLPEAADLLAAAQDALTRKVIPALPENARYEALMIGNALRIAIREIAANRGNDTVSTQDQERVLAAAIRRGEHDGNTELARELRRTTIEKLRISNPKALAATERQ